MENILKIKDGILIECLDKNIESVIIPNGVTTIGYSAFEYCKSLTDIFIPSSVTHIGNYTFEYCERLTNITLQSSVTSIGYGALSYCKSLKIIEYKGENVILFYNFHNIKTTEIENLLKI